MKTGIIVLGLLCFSLFSNAQNTLLEAKTQLQNRKYKSALSLINKDIENRGLQEDNAILRSEILMYISADQCFESIQQGIKLFPKSAQLYLLRANFYFELKDYKNSLQDDTKAIELATVDSIKFWALMERGTCYNYLNFIEKGINDLKEALNIRPNNTNALSNLSMALFDNGKPDEAQKLLLQVLELDSTLIGTYINLGYQNQQLGRYAEAEKYLSKGLTIDANQPYLLNNLGFVQYKLGKSGEGIKNINRSLKYDPTNSYCYRNLALIYIDQNEKNKACENIKKAINLGFSKQYGPEMDELSKKFCL